MIADAAQRDAVKASVGPGGDTAARPTPSPKVRDQVADWWDETDDLPQFDGAVRASEACIQALFPAWWSPKDPMKGRKPTPQKVKRDTLEVQQPHAYLTLLQTVAMVAPEDHIARWTPQRRLRSMDGGPKVSARDRYTRQYSRTLSKVAEEYAREANMQEVVESWMLHAGAFPMAILKIFFQRDLHGDAIGETGRRDEQDTRGRLRVLLEDYARGVFDDADPRMIELRQLMGAVGGKSTVEVQTGIVVENVPVTQFRFAPGAWSPITIYDTPWMAHDVELTDEEIRSRFPFRMVKQAGAAPAQPAQAPAAAGQSAAPAAPAPAAERGCACDAAGNEWSGVHPDDLEGGTKTTPKQRGDAIRTMRDRPSESAHKGTKSGRRPTGRRLVREVWSKRDLRVYVLVEGVPYVVHSYVPERTPAQWYPFVVVVGNEFPGQPYGVSDVELMKDAQDRKNRKRTDEEKSRWLSLPRMLYNSQTQDEKEVAKISATEPGTLSGVKINGTEGFAKDFWELKHTHIPAAFDTMPEDQDMRAAARLPEQALGVTGNADFSSEVQVAAQGAAVAVQARQARFRRALERAYDVIGQILAWELTPEDVKECVGDEAVWPIVYSEQEAAQIYAEIQQQARLEVMANKMRQRMAAAAAPPADPMGGMAPAAPAPAAAPFDPQAMLQQAQQEIAAQVEAKCLERFGFPEPVTREGLYRRMHVKVKVSLKGQPDRERRLAMIMQVCQRLAEMTQALVAGGVRANPVPLLREIADLLGVDDEMVDDFLAEDPNQVAASLLQLLDGGAAGTLDPKIAAVLGPVLMQIGQPAVQAAQAQGAAPAGGAEEQGEPAAAAPPQPAAPVAA